MYSNRKFFYAVIMIVISSGILQAMESISDTDKSTGSREQVQFTPIANSIHSQFKTGKEIKALQWKNANQLIIMHDLGEPTVWDIQGTLTEEKPNSYHLAKSNTNADYSLYDKHGIMAYRFTPQSTRGDIKTGSKDQSINGSIHVCAHAKNYHMNFSGMIAALQLFVYENSFVLMMCSDQGEWTFWDLEKEVKPVKTSNPVKNAPYECGKIFSETIYDQEKKPIIPTCLSVYKDPKSDKALYFAIGTQQGDVLVFDCERFFQSYEKIVSVSH